MNISWFNKKTVALGETLAVSKVERYHYVTLVFL